MSIKIVNIIVPNDAIIPEITGFSPEENYLMLKIGCECLMEGRKVVAGLTQKEIYKKLKEETKNEITKMEMDLIVEREMCKKMEETFKKMHETEIERYKTQIDSLKNELNDYKIGSKDLINSEVCKIREKYELMYREKEKQVNYISENYEKLLVQSNKSSSRKGSEGEKEFRDYAETFIDFKGFELIDKHTQGGDGDFHMRFEDFDILVDAKNYKSCVPSRERDKIKNDLIKNQHIHFAWLVSLNTTIDKFDKSPIMYEWINTNQCIVYINKLACFSEPSKILRIAWFSCKEIYKFVEEVSVDNEELKKMKNKQFETFDKIKELRKLIRELNTTLNTAKNQVQLLDNQLKGLLETNTNELMTNNFSLFDDWWCKNIDETNEEECVLSTDMWIKFKQDNKDFLEEFEITTNQFKDYIKSKVPLSNLLMKTKNQNSAFDIKGIRLKIKEGKEKEEEKEEKIEVEFNEEVIKKKKVIKKGKRI